MGAQAGENESYEHRSHIDGIPHCPRCGGMLWPPAYTGSVVTESGRTVDSITDVEGGTTCFHTECYENGNRDHTPVVKSENAV